MEEEETCDACGEKPWEIGRGSYLYCDACHDRLRAEGAMKEVTLKLTVWCPFPGDYVGKRVVEQYQEVIERAGGDYMEIPVDDTGKKWTGVTLSAVELVSVTTLVGDVDAH